MSKDSSKFRRAVRDPDERLREQLTVLVTGHDGALPAPSELPPASRVYTLRRPERSELAKAGTAALAGIAQR
jgi:hypothetical protein